MIDIHALEPAIDPNGRPTFLLDWELTLKCNLDCSYCGDNLDSGGHYTKAKHPPLNECLKTIDFMFQYVDLYMQYKPKWTKAVVLNIYGGESLIHPDIVEILKAVNRKYQYYKEKWPLKITCTTNGIIGRRRMSQIVDLIEEFTVSYHCENLPKQKQQFFNNVLYLHHAGKMPKVIVLMHSNEKYWPELLEVIDFCQTHGIKFLPRQLDGDRNSNYNKKQVEWFENFYKENSKGIGKVTQANIIATSASFNDDGAVLSDTGRACCGGRNMCINENLKQPVFYITNNNFNDWYCSVNWFFLYIKQTLKTIYVNKDCRMNFEGEVKPIGTLDNTEQLLEWTKKNLQESTMPIIQCKKHRCVCGLCSPKALHKNTFTGIMKKHLSKEVFE